MRTILVALMLTVATAAAGQEVPETAAETPSMLEQFLAGRAEEELQLDRPARREIQLGLEAAGFDPGGVDGLFGPRTRAAIRAWQSARGFLATGYLDEASAAALRASAVAQPEVAAAAGQEVPETAYERFMLMTADELHERAAAGDADAQYQLGRSYLWGGHDLPEDGSEAVAWFELAAEQGHGEAMRTLGLIYSTGSGVPEDQAEAVSWYRRAAEQGDTWAAWMQNRVGDAYQYGRGVPQDQAEAVWWYRRAAEQGHSAAQFNLALAYATGDGVPQDDYQAASWFRRAAEQGDTDAQLSLGLAYAHGLGVPQNYDTAVTWFRLIVKESTALARELGLDEPRNASFRGALYNLGVLYRDGLGVPQDYIEAVAWFRRAANQGHAGAQNNLGIAYERGEGVAQDYAEAVGWYQRAAEQGGAIGQFNLGRMYHGGRGVPQDYAEAAVWYRRAAEQGNTGAQNSLGILFAEGHGVPQDNVEAHMLFNLAATQGTEGAVSNRDKVAGEMTGEQLAEAQRRAREWFENNR